MACLGHAYISIEKITSITRVLVDIIEELISMSLFLHWFCDIITTLFTSGNLTGRNITIHVRHIYRDVWKKGNFLVFFPLPKNYFVTLMVKAIDEIDKSARSYLRGIRIFA